MSLAVLLPGRAYPVDRPAVAAVGRCVAAAGYDVAPVSWGLLAEVPPDPDRWVAARLVERLVEAAADGCDLVVAKSLGTRAASYVAGRGWSAVWVTPLLRVESVVAGIRANPAPQLLVCGGADPLHDPAVAADLAGHTCAVLELPGLDHSLSSTRNDDVTAATTACVADATSSFLAGLAGLAGSG